MNGGNWKMKCVDDGGCSFCKTGKGIVTGKQIGRAHV